MKKAAEKSRGEGNSVKRKSRFGERFKGRFDEKIRERAERWLGENSERLRELADNRTLQGVVFEPFEKLLNAFGSTTEEQVKRTITQVALANGVLAGLPGKLGVGVFVCVALEAWMAYRIAKHLGVGVDSPGGALKLLGIGAAGILGFVHVLRAVFSLLAATPALPATFLAEFVTTTFFGVFFWLAFKSAGGREKLGTATLVRLGPEAVGITRAVAGHQWGILKKVARPSNVRTVASRMRAFLLGERPVADAKRRRGEIFASAGLAHLLQGRTEAFDGPLGEMFLQSVRDRWADIGPDASAEEIAEFMRDRDYTAEQLEGVVNVIKGKMFERLVEKHENADGDRWTARLHGDESFAGSDIVFTDAETGREIEVSLKSTAAPALVENALLRYPEHPVITTGELAEHYADDPRVTTTEWNDEELERVTRGNWDKLARETSDRWGVAVNLGEGSACVRLALLWPNVARFLRGKRSREELEKNLRAELGDAGAVLATRVAMGAALGPVYVWYLLARGILELTPDPEKTAPPPLRLECRYE